MPYSMNLHSLAACADRFYKAMVFSPGFCGTIPSTRHGPGTQRDVPAHPHGTGVRLEDDVLIRREGHDVRAREVAGDLSG